MGPRGERGFAVDTGPGAGGGQYRERFADRGLVTNRPVAAHGIEPDRARLAQQLLHVEQRRQSRRDPLDQRLVALLTLLDLFPVGHDRIGSRRVDVTKHMRVAPHELVVDTARNIGNRECTRLRRQHGMNHHLEQQVAQLVLERVV